MLESKYEVGFLLGAIAVIISAWVLQAKMFLHWDISFLLTTAEQLLHGGNYIKNFFTPNTPMILYLYIPPVIVSKFFGLNLISSFHIYVSLIVLLSFMSCYYLSQHIFLKQNVLLRNLFLIVLLAIFIIVPLFDYGQRDHLFFVLGMPYLFLAAYRLQGHTINVGFAVGIGLMAGLGFAIKPQFVITPLLIECYYMLYKKNWFAWARAETITIFLTLVFYTIVLLIFHRDYLFIVIPSMLHSYYQSISSPWVELVFNDLVYFSVFILLFYVFSYREKHYEILSTIISLGIISFFVTYVTQGTLFYYHFLPLFSASILLFTLTYGIFIRKYPHYFVIALGIIIYLVPVYLMYSQYKDIRRYKKHIIDNLVAFMQTQPPHPSVYVLSTKNYAFTMVVYAGAITAQRFDSLWMISGLVDQRRLVGDKTIRDLLKNDKDEYFFLNMIADDLHRTKPELVFVDIRKFNINVLTKTGFDYISYFSENEKFRNEWKSYHYLTTVFVSEEDHVLYQLLQVYKRK